MIASEPLPPELQLLERALARRPLPEPSGELQRRVLADVQVQLRAKRRHAWWQFAAAVAAAALVWMNLSMSATQDTDFGFSGKGPDESRDSAEAIVAHFEQVAAGLPPGEERIK